MTYLVIFFINVYQQVFSPLLRIFLGQQSVCRYEQSCSSYAKEQIQYKGVIKGSIQGMKRLLSCQPYAKGGFING